MKRIAIAILACTALSAGSAHADRVSIGFPDTSKPGLLYVASGNGDIVVTGYNGREIIVETDDAQFKTPDSTNSRTRGLKRLAGGGMRVEPNTSTNAIEVIRTWHEDVDLVIQAPFNTSIYVGGGFVNGDIEITGVTGEIDITTMDGDVILDNISGTLFAHTMDGDIQAVFVRVDPDSPMSISTMSGDIDVTVPANLKAAVKFSTMSGDMYTDFDIQSESKESARENEHMLKKILDDRRDARRFSEDNYDHDFNFNFNFDFDFAGLSRNNFIDLLPQSTYYGLIDGGGMYIEISSMDGDIFFRKNQ